MPSTIDTEEYDDNEVKMRQHEKLNAILYENEIQNILADGNFENNINEEIFLITDLYRINTKASLKLISDKLEDSIDKMNSNEETDETRFRYLLSVYIDMSKNEQDFENRKRLVDEKIASPKLKKIFNEYWGSAVPADENSEFDITNTTLEGG